MLLTAQEAADVLRVSKNTISDWRWRKKVGLETVRIGGALRFDAAAVDGVIERGRQRLPTALEHRG